MNDNRRPTVSAPPSDLGLRPSSEKAPNPDLPGATSPLRLCAERIADALLVDYFGNRGERLAIMDGANREIAGRCRAAAVDVIVDTIADLLLEYPERLPK